MNNASGSYSVIGGSGGAYDGRYQMGSLARQDAARILGIPTPTRQQLRSNPQLQEDMFLAYTSANHGYMMKGSEKYRNATPIQRMQYLGYAHNQGWSHAADWLETGVISTTDGFGTKGTKFTDKLAKTLRPYTGRDVSGSPTSPEQGGQQPGQSPQPVDLETMDLTLPQGTPETTVDFDKPAYEGSGLPMVSPGIVDLESIDLTLPGTTTSKPQISSGPKRTPPPPPSRSGGGGSGGKVPVLAANGPQVPTSSSSDSGGSTAPMFSPLDTTNPELIVVKSIYNIVG